VKAPLLQCVSTKCLVLLIGLLGGGPLSAQTTVPETALDTLYVIDRSQILTARLFSSTKYNALRIGAKQGNDLVLRPTNQINFGVGASYRKFTLNLGVGIPFLTRSRRERFGHTRYLDAQANLFGPERATNLFLQYFRGYGISSHTGPDLGWNDQDTERPFRDDISQFNFGVTTLRVFNSRRYSFRAPLNQDAWQRRSQGSWLFGAYGSYYRLRADSSLVPRALHQRFAPQAAIRQGDFLDAGPMGGYAYTLVFRQRFFLMGSAALGVGLSLHHLQRGAVEHDRTSSVTTVGPGWHLQLRGGIGTNSRRNQIGITFNHEHVHYMLPIQGMFAWNVGNIRFNIVHRFEKRVKPLDRTLRKLKPNTPAIIQEAVPAIKEAEQEEE
jgi:hypothetical protein